MMDFRQEEYEYCVELIDDFCNDDYHFQLMFVIQDFFTVMRSTCIPINGNKFSLFCFKILIKVDFFATSPIAIVKFLI